MRIGLGRRSWWCLPPFPAAWAAVGTCEVVPAQYAITQLNSPLCRSCALDAAQSVKTILVRSPQGLVAKAH